MDAVQSELTRFQKEFLWELSIPEKQVMDLAASIPAESFSWRPAENARSFSEALVHIAAGCFMLLYRAEKYTPEVMKVCGSPKGDGMAKWVALVRHSLAIEKRTTAKNDVLALLKRGFAEVRHTFAEIGPDQMDASRDFGGETTTVRRIYLRILAHSHEHMGQVVAYARIMGYKVPWPDPIELMEQMVANSAPR